MLRFFRKYNKILLVVFGTGLMVIFLIEPAMRGCGATGPAADLGTVGGKPVTVNDQQRAAVQLQVLAALGGQDRWPMLMVSRLEPLQWMFTSMAAREIGLSVGSGEIDAALEKLGVTDAEIATVSQQLGVARAFVRASVGEWILIDRYRGLVYGMAPLSIDERVKRYNELAPLLVRGNVDPTWKSLPLGDPYICDRLVKHFIHSWRSLVQISMIVVPQSENSDVVEIPSEDQVLALFEKHKGDAAGQGKPHGFGYLVPDRVTLEYLALSIDAVEAQVELSEREALEFHRNNRSLFTEEVAATDDEVADASDRGEAVDSPDAVAADSQSSTTRQLRYAEARQQVRQRALRDKAEREADKIIRRARKLLNEPLEQLDVQNQYRKLPDDFVPLPFQDVAAQILQEYGVALQVHDAGGAWYVEKQLRQIPELASAMVKMPGGRGGTVPFAFYALSVRELGAKSVPALARLHLQTGVVSLPLASADGRYLFRVTAISPFATPVFEDVREAVVSDARKLAAYDKLVADTTVWTDRVSKFDSLEEASEQMGQMVWSPPPFSARQMAQEGLQVPMVEGIGRNERFVDEIFTAAANQWVVPGGETSPGAEGDGEGENPPALIAVPVPERLSLCIVRIDKYMPIPRSAYNQIARMVFPFTRAILTDLGSTNPLTIEALQKRLDYQRPGAESVN